MTVEDLLTQFGYAIKDTADIGDSFYQWVNILNNTYYRIVQNIEPARFYKEYIYSGAGEFDLPDDLDNFARGECGFEELQDNGDVLRRLPQVKRGDVNRTGYYIKNDKVVIQNVVKTVKVRYIPLLTQASDIYDSIVLDERWTNQNIEFLKKLYGEWDLDGTFEGNAISRMEEGITELIHNYNRQPQVINMN